MLQKIFTVILAAVVAGLFIGAGAARGQDATPAASSNITPATGSAFGLYPGADFRLTQGACKDCATPKQALWYFHDDLVAVPAAGVKVAEFSRGVAVQEDVKRWYVAAAAAKGDELQVRPQMLWMGAPSLAKDAKLSASGDAITFSDGASVPFKVTPKIKTNLSYYNDSSKAFFQQRSVRMRGEMQQDTFVARTLWPQDWVIDETQMTLQPLRAGESLLELVRKHANGKDERFETRLLWEKSSGASRDWSGRAVIGIMLNGAQGDDDEAHGGHFAIATGRFGNSAKGGEWADWTVNNFYNLGSFSEKGITGAMLPMDNYMADVNSGQSWYRPSYLLVAVLKSDRAAYAYQGAISRVYHHYYRHDFEYRHAGANCAGISIDTLRALGWNIPTQGPTSVVKAVAAYPYKSIVDMSFTSGKQAYDYMIEEQSRLYPAAAYDAAGRDLMRIAGGGVSASANANSLENLLREDLEALVFVRIPQLPSSRAFGSFPVASIDEYMKRVPEDKSQWKIVPVDPRPFPPALIEADTLTERQTPPWAPALSGVVLIAGVLSIRSVRKRRAREAAVKLIKNKYLQK